MRRVQLCLVVKGRNTETLPLLTMSMFQVTAIRTPEFAVVLGFAAFIVESGTIFLGLHLAIFDWPIGSASRACSACVGYAWMVGCDSNMMYGSPHIRLLYISCRVL